jgi:hypothetical protein
MRMSAMRCLRSFGVFFSLVLLAACETAPPPSGSTLPPASWPAYGEPFRLDVAEVLVEKNFPSAAGSQALYPLDLTPAVEDWAVARLRAVGSHGKARVVVGNAIIQESIKRKIADGGLGFERFRHYQGVIEVRIDVTDISTQRFGFPAATASLRRTAPVDIDAARRRRIGEAMAADMLRRLDRALAAQIRERLAGFIR